MPHWWTRNGCRGAERLDIDIGRSRDCLEELQCPSKMGAATVWRAALTAAPTSMANACGGLPAVRRPSDVDVEAFGPPRHPVSRPPVRHEAYAAVVYAQTAIVAAIAVAKEVGDLERIAAVEIATTRRVCNKTGATRRNDAATRDTADPAALHHDAGDVRRRHRQ